MKLSTCAGGHLRERRDGASARCAGWPAGCSTACRGSGVIRASGLGSIRSRQSIRRRHERMPRCTDASGASSKGAMPSRTWPRSSLTRAIRPGPASGRGSAHARPVPAFPCFGAGVSRLTMMITAKPSGTPNRPAEIGWMPHQSCRHRRGHAEDAAQPGLGRDHVVERRCPGRRSCPATRPTCWRASRRCRAPAPGRTPPPRTRTPPRPGTGCPPASAPPRAAAARATTSSRALEIVTRRAVGAFGSIIL